MARRVLLYSRVNPDDQGGVQAVFRRLSEHLRRCGHQVVRVWGYDGAACPDGDIACELPRLVWRRGLPAPRSLLGAGCALLRLAIHLARLRPHVVNLHFVTSEALYFVLLKPLFRYRLVLSVHGSDVLRPKLWNVRLLPRLLRCADVVTTVSALAAERVRAMPRMDPSKVQVIPNGVPYEFWSAGRATIDATRHGPLVLAVGRLHPVKGHDILLHAFARVRARVPGVRLAVVGDGNQRAALGQLARDLDLTDCVELPGQVDAGAVRDYLSRASVFVLPSRSEGLPLTLVEAMAAGVPVVATGVGGVPDVLAPGTGLLVPPEDPTALAGAIVDLLVDTASAAGMARRARARARQFSAARADAAYERVLCRIAA